jgi:hypothetical protein
VGEAVKMSPNGQSQVLQAGDFFSPGDRIRTGPSGVAILVFSDEGRVSLRADSELLIRHYDIDPTGVKTRIDLELIKGTVRQISGNASRAQPDRYRLNTPIAVIGVRGTDFIAKTAGDAVEAFVHEGKIVLLPPASRCSDASTYACLPLVTASSSTNLRYVRLNSDGQVEQREFRPGELEKIFGIDTARSRIGGPVLSRSAAESQLPVGSQFITDTIFVAGLADAARTASGTAGVGQTNAQAGQTQALESGSPSSQSVKTTEPIAPGAAVATEPATASTSQAVQPPQIVTAPSLPKDLVWGRFTNATLMTSQLTMLAFADVGVNRHITVGELGEYALWRANPSGRLDSSLRGTASFSLAAAEAWLTQATGSSSATVKGASLSVDFDLSTFSASVALNHSATGDAHIAVSGRVNNEGLFVGTTPTERVAGALSRDGKEAGYLFSKDVSAGTFRGVTLWGRK